MEINTHETVGEIVARVPRAAEVFEDLHIDYCCRGARRLADACADLGLPTDEVVQRLATAAAKRDVAFVDWSRRDAAAIIAHLLETHHPYTRKALDRKDLDRRQAANKAPALKRKLKLVSRDQTLKDRTQCKPATKDLQPSRSKSQQWLQPLQLSPRGRFGKTTTVTRNNLR